jgi:RNA polymerase sigma-70 factor (ECF subfamily)
VATSVENLQTIHKLRNRDHDTFEAMVHAYGPELFRHARRRTLNDAAAEDIVQETFTRAYRALPRLRDDSNVRPWLHHILANVCIDEANRRDRETAKVTRLFVDPAASLDSPGVEAELGLDLDDTSLQSALLTLTPEYRDALVLRFVDELEYDELAYRSGISEQNARARVSRARSMMRTALTGAAAIPLFVYTFFRRSSKAAAALDRAESTTASSMGIGASAQMNRLATVAAPAMEAASSVAAQAPTVAPMFAKVAVGVGLVATAAFTASSDSAPPAAASIVVPDRVVSDQSGAVAAPAVGDPVVTSVGAAPAAAAPGAPTVDAAPATVAPTVSPTVPPTVAPTTPVTAAPTVPPTTAPPVTVPPTTVPPTSPPTTTAPAVLGGSVSGPSISVTAAGPRFDLSGPVSFAIGDTVVTATLSGRLGVNTTIDRNGRQRLDGQVTASFGSDSIDLRLAGFATATADPSTFTLVGRFSASGGTAGLVTSGSFSGTLTAGSLSLSLTP